MAAGTAASLVPIKSITMRSRGLDVKYQGGGDKPGPVIVKLLEQLKGIQQGKVKDTFGWVEKVSAYQAGKDYEQDGVDAKGPNDDAPSQLP